MSPSLWPDLRELSPQSEHRSREPGSTRHFIDRRNKLNGLRVLPRDAETQLAVEIQRGLVGLVDVTSQLPNPGAQDDRLHLLQQVHHHHRIAVIRNGRIVAQGTPHALMNDEQDDYVRELMATPRRQAERLRKLGAP